jgi:hypothetical protein
MEIKFSRHAKRRARLYGISESKITAALTSMNLHDGEQEVIKDIGMKYPLKIVVLSISLFGQS